MKSELKTFSVHAALDPVGRAERINTIYHRTFAAINEMFGDHNKVRWLVVTIHATDAHPGIRLIDLWKNIGTQNTPYVKPYVIPEIFETDDQAIGYAALSLVS